MPSPAFSANGLAGAASSRLSAVWVCGSVAASDDSVYRLSSGLDARSRVPLVDGLGAAAGSALVPARKGQSETQSAATAIPFNVYTHKQLACVVAHTSYSGSGPLSTGPEWALAAHTVHCRWARPSTLFPLSTGGGAGGPALPTPVCRLRLLCESAVGQGGRTTGCEAPPLRPAQRKFFRCLGVKRPVS